MGENICVKSPDFTCVKKYSQNKILALPLPQFSFCENKVEMSKLGDNSER